MRCNAYLKIKKKKLKKNQKKTKKRQLLMIYWLTQKFIIVTLGVCVFVFFFFIYILNVYSLILFSKKKITT